MTAHLIDGDAAARDLKDSLTVAVRRNSGAGLATVLTGDDYGSTVYERRLRRLAGELAIPYFSHTLPSEVTQSELTAVITDLNARADVSGILVLRPLPAHIDESAVFRAIEPAKDVEAVHPENAGLLALGVPRFLPSTAASVFHLLDTWLDTTGENRADFYHRSLIVVVGRSNNVGKPCVALGHARQAAVESVDEWVSRTGALSQHTRRADVLVAAAGKPGLISAEHVKTGAVVLDVGINPVTGDNGRVRMTGDVDFPAVAEKARAITPVPGGVGPLTDVWLLRNTVLAAQHLAEHWPSHRISEAS